MADEEDFTSLKLLVADDSPLNHRVVSLSLRGCISQVDSAYDGLEAFEKFKENRYDVILMDMRMPVINGCESAALIRMFEREENLSKKCLIVAMTANDFDDDIQSCLDKGMDTYLGKPFQVNNFLQILHERFNPLS